MANPTWIQIMMTISRKMLIGEVMSQLGGLCHPSFMTTSLSRPVWGTGRVDVVVHVAQMTAAPTKEIAVGRKISVFGTEVCFIRSRSRAAVSPTMTVAAGTMISQSRVRMIVCCV